MCGEEEHSSPSMHLCSSFSWLRAMPWRDGITIRTKRRVELLFFFQRWTPAPDHVPLVACFSHWGVEGKFDYKQMNCWRSQKCWSWMVSTFYSLTPDGMKMHIAAASHTKHTRKEKCPALRWHVVGRSGSSEAEAVRMFLDSESKLPLWFPQSLDPDSSPLTGVSCCWLPSDTGEGDEQTWKGLRAITSHI